MLHTKFMIADDEVAVMGSSNMDIRSFELNYEVTLMVEKGDVISALHDLAADYRAECTELTTDQWNSRPMWRRYLENVARLTSALQ